MSNRPQPLSPIEQAEIGRVIEGWRQDGWCWKRIEAWLGLSHAQAWRCHKRYWLARMKQNASGMKQHSA